MEQGDQRKINLPIRLVPSRQAAIFGALFMLVWLGILIFISSQMVPMAFQGLGNIKNDPAIILFFIVPLFMFCTGAAMFVFFAGRFLPGSPFDHLSIREEGLVRRLTWKAKTVKWADIHRFDCIERIRKTKHGSIKYWLVMAERDGAASRNPDQRAREALLSFDSGIFAQSFKDKAAFAAMLTAWLNDLLASLRSGRLQDPVALPTALADAIRFHDETRSGRPRGSGDLGTRPAKAPAITTKRRRSVIER
ncbi:hypothetical protein [Dongia sp.]|uniref:hypothetical protein n=1 Tax=Dongia sp. TaxID=1977262 RepID=UPI0035B4983B